VIHPYTDLLLHDLGPGLADDQGTHPSQQIWRTSPLWGLGLRGDNVRRPAYLHDGRATTLSEAILWHAGDAHVTTTRYLRLPPHEQNELLRFLESL
jgi:CxxC motif-containing protein (DUF1111 family)